MVDWAQILVIILSIFLAVFLLLAIVLAVMLIRITRQIKTVTHSAMRTVEHMETAAAGFSKFSSPLFVAGLIKKVLRNRKNNKKDK